MNWDAESSVITKVEAAKALLDAALTLLLDSKDYLSAIVLAGAAEDIFQGSLAKGGNAAVASRAVLASTATAMHQFFRPDEESPSEKDTVDVMRRAYNWLRHNDRADDAEALRLNWRHEAVAVAARAVDNLYEVTGIDHPRGKELRYPVGSGRGVQQTTE